MSTDLSHIPAGYHSVTPSLTCRDAAAALEFYRNAFGAVEVFRLAAPGVGKVMHAEIRIGNSTLMMSDEYPEWDCLAPEFAKGGSFMIYVAAVEASFTQAVAAGAKVVMPVTDQFWGDRMGRVACPFGYRWSLSQKVREVPPDEIARLAAEWKPAE
jgi:uncharacterized glyoxalase superfamily protein PhnB